MWSSLPQDQTESFNFLISQRDNYYVHIGSTLCLRNTLRKYNTGVYASGTNMEMNLRLFVFITYICGFRNDRQMIEYNKDKWIDKKDHDVLQQDRNAKKIIRYDNELKLIILLR